MMRAWPLLLSCLLRLASSVRTFFAFCGALLTMLRATRSRLSFKTFPVSTLIPRLQHKLLSNVCEVLSMPVCRPHTGSWLLFLKG